MTSSPDVPFYPVQRSWGQARSQEYRYLYSFLKDLDKILSHEKKKKKMPNKSSNILPDYFLPIELYVTIAGVKHAQLTVVSIIIAQ